MNFGRRPSRSRRVERLLELVDAHAVGVHLDLHDVGLVARTRHGARVGRRLGDDHVAGVDQRLADQVDHLLAAGGDDHVVGVDVACPRRPSPRRCASRVVEMPSVGPYWSARGARTRRRRAAITRGERLGREGRGVGQAAGERDHLGALGDRHQVAHRRGASSPACARRTAPRSARGRARPSRARAAASMRRGSPSRGPRPLSSTVMRARTVPDRVKLLLDISRAWPRRGRRHPPVPARARRRRAAPRGRAASTSTAPTSRSWRTPWWLAGDGGRSRWSRR